MLECFSLSRSISFLLGLSLKITFHIT